MRFVDIQVNGYAGVDLLAPISPAQLTLMAHALERDGVEAALPTIITNDVAVMAALLGDLRNHIDEGEPWLRHLFPAVHLEGPCLSPEPGYRGAHPPAFIRPATRDVFEPLIEAAGGIERVAMVTLAPENDPGLRTTGWLASLGILVAMGHTNAPLPLLREAEDAGVSLFTHFGNGCASTMPRHDNIIQRAMSLEKIKFALIPDGHHVPWFVLRNWLRWIGLERCLFTTDCVAPAGAPPGRYTIGPYSVEVGPERKVHPPGQDFLSGSALTMPEAFHNATTHLGVTETQAQWLCRDHARQLLAPWLHKSQTTGSQS